MCSRTQPLLLSQSVRKLADDLRVGHYYPPDICPLPDADPAGTECLEASHLGGLVFGAQIEVQAVLHGLLLGDAQEHEVGGDTILGTAGLRFEHHPRSAIQPVRDPVNAPSTACQSGLASLTTWI